MVTVYVEGGNKGNLRHECRKGFRLFFEKAGFKGKMPSFFPSSGRGSAYKDYHNAVKNNENAMLLVDSETAISPQYQKGSPDTWQPWAHLKSNQQDQWEKPEGGKDADCHLMVQAMESWFLADRDGLKAFFGQGFSENALPPTPIEDISKQTLFSALKQATRTCKTKTKAIYDKGAHSFQLLARIDPKKVTQASPWAKRFVDAVQERMSA